MSFQRTAESGYPCGRFAWFGNGWVDEDHGATYLFLGS
jgi:hypothetical protein